MTVWRLLDPRYLNPVTLRLSLEPPDPAIEALVEDALHRHGLSLERVRPTDPPDDPTAYLP